MTRQPPIEVSPRGRATAMAASVGLLSLVASACATEAADTPPAGGGLQLAFAALAEGGCSNTPNGSGALPGDVKRLKVTISAPGAPDVVAVRDVAEVSSAGLTIRDVPVGDVSVRVTGCGGGGAARWTGESRHVAISEAADSNVRVFLAPIGQLACTGNASTLPGSDASDALSGGRAFAAAVRLDDDDAAVLGGLDRWRTTAGSRGGTAAKSTWRYDHRAGNFRAAAPLQAARAWHHAFALGGGSVLVAGGVSALSHLSSNTSPWRLLHPADAGASAVSPAAELWTQGASAVSPADVGAGGLPLSGGAQVGDRLVFAGGLDPTGAASADATWLADLDNVRDGGPGNTTTVAMQTARVRPALVGLASGDAIVWGGQATGGAEALGERLKAEGGANALVIDGDPTLRDDPNLPAMDPAVVVIQDESASGGETVLLVVGGMPRATQLDASAALSYGVRISGDNATLLPLALTGGSRPLPAGLGTSAALLPGGEVLVGGGLVGATPCGNNPNECIADGLTLLGPPADTAGTTLPLTVLDEGTLSTGRAGMSMAPVGLGLLVAGGLQAVVAPVADPTAAVSDAGQVFYLPASIGDCEPPAP